jgi:2-dehydropantoate 2-reductase
MGGTAFASQSPGAVRKMKGESILILGTGALATLFAARFARAGIPVTMLGTWVEGMAAINEKGINMEGDGKKYRVHATADPADCKGMLFAIVLVKAWQTGHAALQLSECLSDDGIALTLQNGLGNDIELVSKLGPARVSQGVTTMGATLNAPGEVCQGGEGPVSIAAQPRLELPVKLLRGAGFEVKEVDNIESLIWGKLVVSSAINPLTALLRVKNGEILENIEARALMGKLARETASVGKKMGVKLPFTSPENAVEEVARRTSENFSSMLQDILRGAPTEIDAINGAVVRLAGEKAVRVPINRTVWSLVKAIPVRGNIKI